MTAAMLARGEVLGGYRIEDLVGIGGMAIVDCAEQLSRGRTVALKVLAPQLSRDAAFRERFRREGTHVAALDHPHVVTICGSGESDGRLHLAKRLVEGITLAGRCARKRSRRRALRLVRGGVDRHRPGLLVAPVDRHLLAAHGRRRTADGRRDEFAERRGAQPHDVVNADEGHVDHGGRERPRAGRAR